MGDRDFLGNRVADLGAKAGASMLQHPEWQRQQYITLLNKVEGVLEFAATVGVKSSDVVDSEKSPPPEPTPPIGHCGEWWWWWSSSLPCS